MKLLSDPEFSASLASQLSETAMPRSEIIVDGNPAGVHVTGAVLEAAIRWRDYTLAFFTDDIPQEDSLRIYLFDAAMRLVDSATVGAMYSTGHFSSLVLLEPDSVSFRFIGGNTWTLALSSTPKLTLPVLSDPKGVIRPFSLVRHFQLSGAPLPGR